jgi:RecJ-like exonuclease
MLAAAIWMLVRNGVRRRWRSMLTMLGSAVCPHCYGGKRDSTGCFCSLCHGTGRIGQAQQEAVRYGKALAQARIERRVSQAFACQFYEEGRVTFERRPWADYENGYVLVRDWPQAARDAAEKYMRDSARRV